MTSIENFKYLKDELYYSLDLSQLKNHSSIIISNESKQSEYSSNMGINPTKFVEKEGKRYFIKYPGYRLKETLFIEVFISFIAKKVGIDCIDEKILIDSKTEALGLMSPDFGEHFTYSYFGGGIDYGAEGTSVVEIVNRLTNNAKKVQEIKIDRKNLLEKLNKISCFDYLTGQKDRHSQNLAFTIVNKEDGKCLDVAPLYDNGLAFIETGKYYKINPNECKIFGLEQQRLLNSQYKEMLEWFENNFSEEKFDKLIEEFNCEYGMNKIYNDIDYSHIIEQVKSTVKEKINYCKYRDAKQTYIPLEAVYAIVKRHKSELVDSAKIDEIAYKLIEYYGEERYRLSYKNFYNETVGEISIWKYYDECKDLLTDENNPELLCAKIELEDKKRELNAKILFNIIKGKEFSHWLIDDIKYLLFDIEIFKDKKDSRRHDKEFKKYQIFKEYNSFKELKEWCNQIENKVKHISEAKKTEHKKIKKLLKRYIAFVNANTNKRLTQQEKERLENLDFSINDIKKVDI